MATPAMRHPGPIDYEIARAEADAAETARRALRDAAVPARSPCCRAWTYHDHGTGTWRGCQCGRGFAVPGPSAADEAAAVREAEETARDAVLQPRLDQLRQRIRVEQRRDRRPRNAVRAAMRSALLH